MSWLRERQARVVNADEGVMVVIETPRWGWLGYFGVEGRAEVKRLEDPWNESSPVSGEKVSVAKAELMIAESRQSEAV